MNCPSCKRPMKPCSICGAPVTDGHGHAMSAAFLTERYEEVTRMRKALEAISTALSSAMEGWKEWNK